VRIVGVESAASTALSAAIQAGRQISMTIGRNISPAELGGILAGGCRHP
jgi:hypothetical protein